MVRVLWHTLCVCEKDRSSPGDILIFNPVGRSTSTSSTSLTTPFLGAWVAGLNITNPIYRRSRILRVFDIVIAMPRNAYALRATDLVIRLIKKAFDKLMGCEIAGILGVEFVKAPHSHTRKCERDGHMDIWCVRSWWNFKIEWRAVDLKTTRWCDFGRNTIRSQCLLWRKKVVAGFDWIAGNGQSDWVKRETNMESLFGVISLELDMG